MVEKAKGLSTVAKIAIVGVGTFLTGGVVGVIVDRTVAKKAAAKLADDIKA